MTWIEITNSKFPYQSPPRSASGEPKDSRTILITLIYPEMIQALAIGETKIHSVVLYESFATRNRAQMIPSTDSLVPRCQVPSDLPWIFHLPYSCGTRDVSYRYPQLNSLSSSYVYPWPAMAKSGVIDLRGHHAGKLSSMSIPLTAI